MEGDEDEDQDADGDAQAPEPRARGAGHRGDGSKQTPIRRRSGTCLPCVCRPKT